MGERKSACFRERAALCAHAVCTTERKCTAVSRKTGEKSVKVYATTPI